MTEAERSLLLAVAGTLRDRLYHGTHYDSAAGAHALSVALTALRDEVITPQKETLDADTPADKQPKTLVEADKAVGLVLFPLYWTKIATCHYRLYAGSFIVGHIFMDDALIWHSRISEKSFIDDLYHSSKEGARNALIEYASTMPQTVLGYTNETCDV